MEKCGPVYLDHSRQLAGVNLAYKYLKDDFPALKKPYAGKGIVYIILDNESPEEALAGWESMMEVLTPDVISIPIVFVAEETEDVTGLYKKFRKVGEEYARRNSFCILQSRNISLYILFYSCLQSFEKIIYSHYSGAVGFVMMLIIGKIDMKVFIYFRRYLEIHSRSNRFPEELGKNCVFATNNENFRIIQLD